MSQTTCLPEESDFEANLIYENDLIRFLDELQEQAHPLYALLAGAPKSVFWIVQEDDDAFPDEKTYSVNESGPTAANSTPEIRSGSISTPIFSGMSGTNVCRAGI